LNFHFYLNYPIGPAHFAAASNTIRPIPSPSQIKRQFLIAGVSFSYQLTFPIYTFARFYICLFTFTFSTSTLLVTLSEANGSVYSAIFHFLNS
jgi:hypothetical protein